MSSTLSVIFKVPHVSESYDAVCALPEGDTVSIDTQSSVHETPALMTILAGNPVLFEKRSAMDVVLANRTARAAWSVEVFRMKVILMDPDVRYCCPLKV